MLFEQIVGKLEVGRALARQQAAAAGLLRFDRLLGDGFLRLRQTLLVDQGLQFLDLAVEAIGFLRKQVVLGIAEILQLGVAGQFLAAQRNQRIECGQFGVQLVALFGGDRFAGVLAGFEDGVDLLDARLAGGNFRLRTLGASLCGDDQAVGFGQGFCRSLCWVERSVRICSSCWIDSFGKRCATGTGAVALRRLSSRVFSIVCFGALAS